MVLVAALGASARAGDPGARCELGRADRARTPSSRCVACHDGSAGPGLGASHPVEVDYAGASSRQPGRYVPASMLSPEIPLADGKVTCLSCHDPASPHRKHAVAPDRICQACHRM
ncbi:MAG TPA: hypothetical protein VIW03_17795 [Anaeromyxobacter sp.]